LLNLPEGLQEEGVQAPDFLLDTFKAGFQHPKRLFPKPVNMVVTGGHENS
jgi:hypothetical protein